MDNKGWLYLKRAFVLLMGTLLVWQTFGTDVTYAFAQGSVEVVQALTQPADTGEDADTSADDGATLANESEGQDDATVAVDDSQDEGVTDEGSADGTTEGDASGESDGSGESDDAENGDDALQLSEEGIALASNGTTGSYNPDVDFVDISNNCNATVELFSDSGYSNPMGSTAVSGTDSFYGKLTVAFTDGYRPTLSNPNVSYTFPANAKVSDLAETTLYDNGVAAGTWYISNGVAYFKYSESYLSQTVVNANIKFEAKLNGVNKGDGSNEQLNFPGTSSAVTVNTKDGNVSGSKFGGNMNEQWSGPTYDKDTNSYTWTVKVSPTAYATNVVVTDTIGSNLTFVDGSFVIVDSTGQQTGTASATVSGQTANISLGNLSAGDYYVQYKTTVNNLPTTDNTAISNVGNSVKWSWGAEGNRQEGKTDRYPQEAKYSMVTKSADGSSTPDAIKWVVTLNSGSLKADMGGYTFSDIVGSDQSFNTSAGVTVTDTAGNVIQVTDKSIDTHSLSFKLPADAGENQYKVVYYTKMSDSSSKDAVSNTAKVTTPDPTKSPSGEATATYNPPDTGTYITKTLVSTVSSDSYDGKASWKSEILFGDMAESTTPTSIEFTDKFGELPGGVQVSLNGDVTVSASDGTSLVAGTDYAIEKATSAQGTWGQLIKITFKDTEAVKSLIGKSGAKVTVSYGTITSQVSGEYPTGTYKNVSSVKTNKKNEISADASYTIEREATPPAVIKNGTSSSWDADYDWGDGTKGAWITDWKVVVNRTGEWEYQYKPVLDLKGADVVVTDVLPTEGYSIIDGDVTYKLREGAYGDPVASGTVTPSYTQSDAVITVPTKKADETPYGKVYVELSYKTATKGTVAGASGTDGAVNKEVSNAAYATSGSYEFPQGSGTVQLSNKALSKTSSEISGSSARQYTIVVNENGYDLAADSDTITLVDDMDSRGTFAASTLSVMAGDGVDLLKAGTASYALSNVPGTDGTVHTRLSLTIPDNTKVTVKYEVMPSGKEGDRLSNFSNTCSLSALADSTVTDKQTFTIASNSGGTSSESWGISITKSDSSGKKNLAGAEFELWQVDMDASTKGNVVSSKVGTATSDTSGKVTFGTEDAKLASNTLYYFKEVKAPAGYEISFTGDTYVMLKSDATKTDYQAAYDKAVELGCNPSNAVTYSAYDELSKGSFELGIEKNVEGADAPAGAEFTFYAEATGSNAESAPKLSDVTVKSTAKGASTYTGYFTGTLSDSMQGQTFTYTVSETGTAPSGWTYDSGTYTATVEVVEQDGKLVGNVSYAKDGVAADKMTFTNTYEAPSVTAQIQAKKVLYGRNMNADEFSFTLTDITDGSETKGQVVDTQKAAAASAGVPATVTFKTLTFTKAGTYDYNIKEVKGNLAQVTYDASVYKARVIVSENDEGKLSAKVVYYNASGVSQGDEVQTFKNTYTPATGSFALKVKKTVNGAAPKASEKFTFSATATGAYASVAPKLENVTTGANGEASFATVTIDESMQGKTFTYVIQEEDNLDAHWAKAPNVVAEVSVGTESSAGTISVQVKYNGTETEAAAFNNTYATSTNASISVEKALEGASASEVPSDKKFTFELYKKGSSELLGTVEATKGKKVSFNALTFTEAGTYEYEIKEQGTNVDGWTYAEPTKATVNVVENADRSLTATVSYDRPNSAKNAALFTNKYEVKAEVNLKVKKAVNGGAVLGSERFGFTLGSVDDSDPTNVKYTTVGAVSITANTADGTAALPALTFDHTGTYKYKLSENPLTVEGWRAADDIDFTITVGYSADGKSLVATMGDTQGRIVKNADGSYTAGFNNSFESSTTATLKVKKETAGEGASKFKDDEFTFELYDGTSATGKRIDTKTVKAGQTLSFDALSYNNKALGTHTYTIHEVAASETSSWFGQGDVTATVEVKMSNDQRHLANPTITYTRAGQSAGTDAALFTNTYSTATATLGVYKSVNASEGSDEDGWPETDKKFTFVLLDNDGKQVGDEVSVTRDNRSAIFGELTFDAPGTYSYTIQETSEDGGSWKNDIDNYATVIVTRDEDSKQLVATVDYADAVELEDGSKLAWFNNTYTAPCKAGISVEKTVNGGAITGDEKFTFALLDSGGEQVGDEVTATKDNPTVAFGELEFDHVGTYAYTVHETTEAASGWTNDSDVIVTLTVGVKDGAYFVSRVSYGDASRGYGEDGSYVVKFNDLHEVPETPNEDTPEKPEDKPKKAVPQTGDALGNLATVAVSLSAAGVALVALGIRSSRRRMR